MSYAGIQEYIEGDNLEFNVATANDITCDFNGGTGGSNTSANDTATTKYTDSAHRRKSFCLRADQACQIIQINNITLTDPYTCKKNGSLTEVLDVPMLTKIVIRVLTNDTNIKLRVR